MKKVFYIVFVLCFVADIGFAQGLLTGSEKTNFVSGDKIIYKNDFHTCPVGEMPQKMYKFLGSVECVRYKNRIWLAPSTRCTEDHESAVYKKLNIGSSEFSIEFDIVALKTHARAMLRILRKKGDRWNNDRFPFDVYFNGINWDKSCNIRLEHAGDIARIKPCPEKKVHLALQLRRGQFRVYVDGKRVIMKPFEMGDVSGFEIRFPADTDRYGVLVSSIKVAEYSNKEAKPKPEELGISVKETKSVITLKIPERVLFDFNKFTLKPKAKRALSTVAYFIKEHSDKKIVVTGYTDNIGGDAYNLKLSLQRAQSVADYLMYVEKLPARIFSIEGKGKANPIASNDTEAGRCKNRRVEIKIVK